MSITLHVFAALIFLAAASNAHQPFESNTRVRFDRDCMELTVTTSREIAGVLVGGSPINGATVDGLNSRLLEAGRGLYEVTANGNPLKGERAFFSLSNEDAFFSVIYPLVRGVEMSFRADYLERLANGYSGSISVSDAAPDEKEMLVLGRKALMTKDPSRISFSVHVPAVPFDPAYEPDQAKEPATPVAPVRGNLRPPAHPLSLLAGGCFGVSILALGARRLFRRNGKKNQSAHCMLVRRLFAVALFFALWISPTGTAYGQRQMERLGRGFIALRNTSSQVYVGWRLLANDPEDIAFNLYRSANGATPVKLNGSPITTTTNYIDTPANLSTISYTYSVKTVLNGAEVPDTWANPLGSSAVTIPVNAKGGQYIPVPLTPTPDDPTTNKNFRVKFAWVGDLDGDGEYDFVVDRTKSVGTAPGSGQQWIQAYKRNGTLLWQMTQGPNSINQDNITPGSSAISIGHNDNVTVYDLDGDGKSEVCVLTANGVVFNYGTPGQTTLTAANNEIQYISVIDGQSGVEKARITVPIPTTWDYQGHVTGKLGIMYPDGIRPSLFFLASNRDPVDDSFNKMAVTWDYRNGVLSQRWRWLPSGHTAEAHQIRFADVDNDGKDEYVDIGQIVKSDGSGQLNGDKLTEVTHGDRFHVTDIDPDRPGMETFLIQQNNSTGLATAYHSADKSALIKKWYDDGVVDVGRGTVGGFVSSLFGLQFFSTQPGTFDAKGNQVYATQPFPTETIWWDGDLGRELLHDPAVAINKFNSSASVTRLFSIYNDSYAPTGNTQADGGRPAFWGDVVGDWREEVVCVASDYSELRIYTTKDADQVKTFAGQNFRIYTLMQNPQYRDQATTKGYTQSSYLDYYLGYGMSPPPPSPMTDAKLVWKGGAGTTTWDAGTTQSWLNNGANSTFAAGDTVRFDISGNNATAVTLDGTLQPGALTVYNPKDYTFAGTGTLAGTMKFLKAGAGALILPGTHTFTGKTTVWDGALVVNGNLQSSPVTVWGGTWGGAAAAGKTGGRIAGTGQFSQPVTIKYRGAITPGAGTNSAGTLTFANGLTAENGSTFALDLSDDPAGITKPNDRISVTGNLTLAGTVKIVINALGGKLGGGEYTLATYSGAMTGGLANLSVVVPEGTPYALSAGSGTIKLTVPTTRAPASVVWRGTSATWDLSTTQNWLLNGSPDGFVAGDTVTFDATGAAATVATLTTALPVGNVTVDSTTKYTLNGPGYLSGTGGITKSGSGTLTVNTANTYTGPTVVNSGVLAVASLADAGSPSAIGASSGVASNFVLNGGILRLLGAQTNTNRNLTLGSAGGTMDVPTNSSIQISGAIIGTGALTKNGDGALLIATANTYSGGTILNGGKIYLAGTIPSASGLGSGSVTIHNGTLEMADKRSDTNAAWNLVVPTGATGRLNADGRCQLEGSLTGGGTFTYYTPYIRTDLQGDWSAFGGRINVIGASEGSDFRIANSFGFANAAVDLGANINGYYNLTMSGNLTLGIGELSGASTATLRGGPTANRTLTWQLGGKGTDSTYAGRIVNSTGLTALTKIGTGTQTLTGASLYTGPTTVSAGKLVLAGGSLSGSNVSVASAAGFGGNGSVTGNVTFNAGSTLLVNPAAGPLAITGNLGFGGVVNVSPAPGVTPAVGTYTLCNYATLTGTPSFLWIGSGYTATFDTSVAGTVTYTLAVDSSRPVGDIIWSGAASATWNLTTSNWLYHGGSTIYKDGDSVLFDDSSTVVAITLGGTVSPASVTVDSTQNHAFSGSGLAGSATLTKSGSGALTIGSAQTYSGGTTINGGTLALGNATALGTGTITLNGGTLGTGTRTVANSIVVTADSRITGGDSGGNHGIKTVSGTGVLTLEATNVFDLESSLTNFTGTVSLTGVNRFRFNGSSGSASADWNLGTRGLTARNGGSIALGSLAGAVGSVMGNDSANSTTPATFTIGANGNSTTFAGVIQNGGTTTALTKSGSGTLTLSGGNTHTGATLVSAGSLLVTGSLGSTAVSVSSGATIGGTGTLGGSLTLVSGARLALGVGPSLTKGLTVSGTSTLNGAITVVPAMLGGALAPGTYTVLTYTGALVGSRTFTWNDTTATGYLGTFDTSTPGQVKLTLVQPLAAPSGLVATPGDAEIGLTWDAVSGATSYNVLRSGISGSGYVPVASNVDNTSLIDTGLTNGNTCYYVVTATNGTGLSGNSNEASATPGQTYSQWAETVFGGETDPAVIGMNADPDHDGYENLLEYFLGTSPSVPDGGSPVTCELDGQGHIVLSFPMSKNLLNVSCTVEQSTNLETWEDTNVTPAVASDEGTYYVMEATVPKGSNTMLFLRLRVTGN